MTKESRGPATIREKVLELRENRNQHVKAQVFWRFGSQQGVLVWSCWFIWITCLFQKLSGLLVSPQTCWDALVQQQRSTAPPQPEVGALFSAAAQ